MTGNLRRPGLAVALLAAVLAGRAAAEEFGLAATLRGHQGEVHAVAFSPDGAWLATGGYDKTIRIWKVGGGYERTLEGHENTVTAVAFSPVRKMLASASADGTVRLWKLPEGTVEQVLKGHDGVVLAVAFSPDGKLVASGGHDQTVRLWNADDGSQVAKLDGHRLDVRCVAFSPVKRILASSSEDRTIRFWHVPDGALERTLEGHTGSVLSIAFSPDGKLLASGSYDKTVRLWDAEAGSPLKVLEGHKDWITGVAFSPNGRFVASSSEDKSVRVWSIPDGSLVESLAGHSADVSGVAFNPTKRYLASVSFDGTVRVWRMGEGASSPESSGATTTVSAPSAPAVPAPAAAASRVAATPGVSADAGTPRPRARPAAAPDRNPPAIDITAPLPGGSVPGDDVVVTGLVQDDRNVAWVEINGKRVGKKRGIAVEKKTKAQMPFEETVKLAAGETRIVVRAADEAGNVAEYAIPVVRGPVTTAAAPEAAPASGGEVAVAPAAKPGILDRIRGRFTGNKPPAKGAGTKATGPAAPAGARPDLYVLSIGVSKYKSGRISLQYADHDAMRLAEVLKTQEGRLYGRVHTRVLVNEGATRDSIIEATGTFLGQASDFDVAMIFIAGHGVQDRVTSSYYYLPYDATPDNLMSRGMRWSDLDEAVTKLRTHVSKVVLFVDTCHAGSMQVAMRGAEAGEELAAQLREAEGTFIVAASKPGETSEERAEWKMPGESRGHGAFTYAILRGLLGGADMDRNGSVSLDELSYYVGKEVPKMTGGGQHPYKRSSGTDMPMAVMPGTPAK